MSGLTLETRACFDLETIRGREVLELIETESAGFSPRFWRSRELTKGLEKYASETSERLRLWNGRGNLEIRASDYSSRGPRLWIVSDVPRSLQTVFIKGLDRSDLAVEAVGRLAGRTGFRDAFVFDESDVASQSTPLSSEAARILEDDISSEIPQTNLRPGRETLLPFSWFVAAWKMWFGPGALAFISRDQLLTFQGAHRVEEISESLILVELFGAPQEVSTPDGRARQAAFREWLGIDAIELASSHIEATSPGYVIETGSFPAGGVRRVTIYSNERGQVVNMREADWYEVFELDPEARIIWRSGKRRALHLM